MKNPFNKIINVLRRLFKKRSYLSEKEKKDYVKPSLIEIAKKVIEEENQTKKINDSLTEAFNLFKSKYPYGEE